MALNNPPRGEKGAAARSAMAKAGQVQAHHGLNREVPDLATILASRAELRAAKVCADPRLGVEPYRAPQPIIYDVRAMPLLALRRPGGLPARSLTNAGLHVLF